MAHLTEDAAIRAGDALDAGDGAVGVDVEVHGRHACHVDVLRGDLTALVQLGQDVVVGDEAALAVGDGNGIELIRVALGEPRRQVAADAGANQAALVTADLVEGQRGRVGGGVDDVAVRHQAQLDECLEAVADAQHKAVAGLQQVANRLGDLGCAEERGDELGGTVWLVAAGEAARDHDDLGLADAAGQLTGGLGDVLGREVVDDEDVCFGAGGTERARGVVLAVVAGEDGDDHAGTGDLEAAVGRADAALLLAAVALLGNEFLGGVDVVGGAAIGEHALEGARPSFLKIAHVERLAVGGELVCLRGAAKLDDLDAPGCGQLGALGELHDEAAVGVVEQVAALGLVIGVGKLEAQLVAKAGLEEDLGQAAEAGGGDGKRLAFADEFLDRVERGEQGVGLRQQVVLAIGGLD